MDISLIIDPDLPTSAQARSAKPGSQQPERIFQAAFEVPPSTRNTHGGTRPPQSPILRSPSQPQSHVELVSPSLSSYASMQSPYPQTPSASLSGSQYPSPQTLTHSPGHSFKSSSYAQIGQRPFIVQPLVKRKRRPTEIPIYAQSSLKGGRLAGANPALRDIHLSAGKPANSNALPGNLNPLPKAQPMLAEHGPSSPWEPSIVNMIPSEEIIRTISDFLFDEVVRREDVGAGAVLEIEAKLGQLIDKNTNERLRLPVTSECILSPRVTGLKITFKSSMTEAQHRSLNKYLNTALGSSQPSTPPPGVVQSAGQPRIPMSYVHTYESDSFFELSPSGALSLPASLNAQLNPRQSKAKVRVTSDQKTGKEIARIIKARVADLDVYSPRTAFDWRVSVNIEMNVGGDLRAKIDPFSMDGNRPERNKNRMSYKHLAYQIDLTQVTPPEATSNVEKKHELEIEVSSAEVRKQGLLAKEGLPNDYERLIAGFVNNVRLLARQCQ